jgi:hypothetical protein
MLSTFVQPFWIHHRSSPPHPSSGGYSSIDIAFICTNLSTHRQIYRILYYIYIVVNYKTIAGCYLSSNFLLEGINGYILWNYNQSGCSLHHSNYGAYYLFSSGMDGFLSGSGAIFINDNVTARLVSIVISSNF